MKNFEVEYKDVKENKEYMELIEKVVNKCFEIENLKNLYLSIILTTPQNIKEINRKYRNIDKSTDVLSFPMFESSEIKYISEDLDSEIQEVLGDIIISVDQVQKQALEYGHSFERELAYMVVHGFYHLMGFDHMNEEEKKQMREKEENVLSKLEISR